MAATYEPAGDTCSAAVQQLMAQWLIFTANGQSAEAAAIEVRLNALGTSMTGA
jgi:hypothetical protein